MTMQLLSSLDGNAYILGNLLISTEAAQNAVHISLDVLDDKCHQGHFCFILRAVEVTWNEGLQSTSSTDPTACINKVTLFFWQLFDKLPLVCLMTRHGQFTPVRTRHQWSYCMLHGNIHNPANARTQTQLLGVSLSPPPYRYIYTI